jgi:hypothetical protein
MAGKPPDHGTYARAHGSPRRPPCRCPKCLKRRSRYDKELRLDHNRGHRRCVPADPVRARLRELKATGATWPQIAALTRVGPMRLIQIASETRPTVWTSTAQKILNAKTDQLPQAPVRHPVTGAARRLRALMAIGHYAKTISEQSGLCAQTVSEILNERTATICQAHHDAVVATYNALWKTPGTSTRSVARARANNWAGPLQWDDEAIDDPAGFPDWTGYCGSGSGWLIHLVKGPALCPACAPHELSADELTGRGATRSLAAACGPALLALREDRLGWRAVSKLVGLAERQVSEAYTLAKAQPVGRGGVFGVAA